MTLIDLTGRKVGKLTVVSRAENRGITPRWHCLCECGNSTVVDGAHLRHATIRSCGCARGSFISQRLLDDLTGQVFGRLTVIGLASQRKRGQAAWLCQCECGNRTTVSGNNLRAGRTVSCGCYHRERLSKPNGVAAFNKLLVNYRARARRAGMEFSLTKEEFRELTQRDCHYCGIAPGTTIVCAESTGGYVYNGLDRIDSSGGYTPDNVVPCCTMCNRAKRDYSEGEFLSWVKRLVRFQEGNHG